MRTLAFTAGRRVVYLMYVVAVAVSALFGYVLGYVVRPNVLDGTVGSLGPVTFALTPLNLAVYGAVMVGLSLGVLLALVSYVSRYDDATPADVEPNEEG
ncbi:VIT1/CCC1 family predicted Fe2+/Mn2+ transporter [Halarchaeum rubridurum]|uniref:VIT1/CCC1 family predicted Fe2+/Mn2+ transporter n=1 Tax=Halarchaeum rubridurum TaxID=489911 RepID=A0A830G2S7_9EURY|nr:hypothetical protein [Halarchaeum rubridurum]MBP1955521.1 VIT1/CCC1 family predicted Fe2+/Mn2+ transporter [Halarchaeum rubridurum]GGM72998.1 hypothetical protein GCM10009017_23730 [Halarchaeum rubridurum]